MGATKRHRIWAQGATDQVGHRNYLAQLLPHIKACTDPDFEIDFKTMTPSVTTVHALSEFRFSRKVIRGAIQAERKVGAGGNLGVSELGRSAPDGYTIGMSLRSVRELHRFEIRWQSPPEVKGRQFR